MAERLDWKVQPISTEGTDATVVATFEEGLSDPTTLARYIANAGTLAQSVTVSCYSGAMESRRIRTASSSKP